MHCLMQVFCLLIRKLWYNYGKSTQDNTEDNTEDDTQDDTQDSTEVSA